MRASTVYGLLLAAGLMNLASSVASAQANALSLPEYQAKLQSLDKLLADCQQVTVPSNCQSEQVGSDPQVVLPTGPRLVRFNWLRDLLDKAAKGAADTQKAKQNPPAKSGASASQPTADKQASASTKPQKPEDSDDSEEDEAAPAPPRFQEPTIAQQLADGRKRLAEESAVAARLSAGVTASPNDSSADASQRQMLTRILEAKEYHAAVASPSLVARVLEKVGNWINRILGKLAEAGFKSKWIGYAAEIGFVLLLSIGLIWFFIRVERQGRLGIGANPFGTSHTAASARDWQLWLEDAREAAAKGEWREGIHLLYWASISRLESAGQWPADRARTPREYLALLAPENTQRPELARLTQSFERTWYAGRAAGQADFLAAEKVASRLGVRPGAQP